MALPSSFRVLALAMATSAAALGAGGASAPKSDPKAAKKPGPSAPPAGLANGGFGGIGSGPPASGIGSGASFGSIGQGRSFGSVGSGRPLAPLGTGRPLAPIGASGSASGIGTAAPVTGTPSAPGSSLLQTTRLGTLLVPAVAPAAGELAPSAPQAEPAAEAGLPPLLPPPAAPELGAGELPPAAPAPAGYAPLSRELAAAAIQQLRDGDYALAEVTAASAASIEPGDPELAALHGLALCAAGNVQGAAGAWRRAQALEPTFLATPFDAPALFPSREAFDACAAKAAAWCQSWPLDSDGSFARAFLLANSADVAGARDVLAALRASDPGYPPLEPALRALVPPPAPAEVSGAATTGPAGP